MKIFSLYCSPRNLSYHNFIWHFPSSAFLLHFWSSYIFEASIFFTWSKHLILTSMLRWPSNVCRTQSWRFGEIFNLQLINLRTLVRALWFMYVSKTKISRNHNWAHSFPFQHGFVGWKNIILTSFQHHLEKSYMIWYYFQMASFSTEK